jgi:uncharacterized protein YecE (DUF72 family)
METSKIERIQQFDFRDLHPAVFIGTASDRYVGWIGQIYTAERYLNKATRRTKRLGGKSFQEDVLPVQSVEEYFEHFSVLEIDFTFYRLLLDRDTKPTENLRVLQTYRTHLRENDRLILKVPQVIFAQRLWRGDKFVENPDYLNPELFTLQFYEPANQLLGSRISGFIFEQEYQPKRDRVASDQYVAGLDRFLSEIPPDHRYHIEVRTESLLSAPYFRVLEKHGVGQVLSHWTWLPPLRRQLRLSGGRFLNAGHQCIVRLMTPLGMRYEEAYAKAYPFNRIIDGMMSPHMVEETVDLMLKGAHQRVQVNVVVNNRAGGNAPIIAQRISEQFLAAYIGKG